jgi:hypothetical protein
VTKVLVVLIDDGPSMTNTLPPGFKLPITYLAAAQNIAQQLLQTVSAQDYVNIIMFNSGGSFELSASGPVSKTKLFPTSSHSSRARDLLHILI